MTIAIGIDLGTTRTNAAVYLNNKVMIIPQDRGETFIHCYVSFTSTQPLIGELAVSQSIVDPENTVYSMKRIIGRRYGNPSLQQDMESFPFKVENHNGNPKISVVHRGEKMLIDPEEISAMILKKTKENAEIFLGHQVTDVVITVPAYFNDSERQATKDAGSIAGLNVIGILNEPTAAALAYGLDRTSKEVKNVLIYDLGSGMFDTSVLRYEGNGFEVKAIAGDTQLGGIDFDNALVNHCAGIFLEEHGQDIKQNFQAFKRLRYACEKAKNTLSCEDETVVAVDAVVDDIDFKTTISRTQFEELCDPLFRKTIELVEEVLHESQLDKKDIDDVVLVGGSTRIPKIQSLVRDFFDGKYLCASINPDEAVAHGAAIRAAILSGVEDRRLKEILFIDVIPLSIGIETSGGAMAVLIPRNTKIPCRETYTVTTCTDNQPGVTIQIFEGERAMTADNYIIGKLELFGFPPSPRGVPQIEVTFEVDTNGILTVSAKETKVYMKSSCVSIRLDKGRLTRKDIERMLKEAEAYQKQDMEEKDRIRLRQAIETYVASISKAAFSKPQEQISEEQKSEIQEICNEIYDWLHSNPNADKNFLVEMRRTVIRRLQSYASILDHSVLSDDDARLLPVQSPEETIT